jgi:hypothetical protein
VAPLTGETYDEARLLRELSALPTAPPQSRIRLGITAVENVLTSGSAFAGVTSRLGKILSDPAISGIHLIETGVEPKSDHVYARIAVPWSIEARAFFVAIVGGLVGDANALTRGIKAFCTELSKKNPKLKADMTAVRKYIRVEKLRIAKIRDSKSSQDEIQESRPDEQGLSHHDIRGRVDRIDSQARAREEYVEWMRTHQTQMKEWWEITQVFLAIKPPDADPATIDIANLGVPGNAASEAIEGLNHAFEEVDDLLGRR